MLSRFARLRGRLPHAIAASLLGGASVLAPVAASAQSGGIADPDTAIIDEDAFPVVIQVLSNDDAGVEITGFSPASDGSVSEVISGGLTTGFTYEPDPDFNDTDSFTYDVIDPSTNETETETVTITVNPVDDAPVAFDDDVPAVDAGEADAIVENGPAVNVTAAILANDVELDGEELTITSIDSTGTIGTVDLDEGSVTFEATDDVATSTSFDYTVSDGTSEASATVNVTIEPVDDLPVAGAVPDQDAAEEETISIDVLSYATDPDGGTLEVVSATSWADGEVAINEETGAIDYTAPDELSAGIGLFEYKLNGGSAGIVFVGLSPVDDAPVAVADTANVDEADTVLIDVLTNDTDVDGGPLNIESVSTPSVGTAVIEANEIRYTHEGDSLNDVTFSYTVNGGSEAEVIVSIANGDQDPITVDDISIDIDEDAASAAIPVLLEGQTDVDGDVLSIVDATDGTLGTTTFEDGTVTYVPGADANGEDTFTVTVTDGDGEYDTDLTVTVNIAPVDDIPVVDDISHDIDEDAAFAAIGVLLEGQTDADGTLLSISDTTDGTLGTTTFEEGTVTYVPAADANGEDTFTVTVTDGTNPIDVTVTVNINPVDDIPVVDDVSIDILEDADTVEITILGDGQTDVDGEVLRVSATDDGDLGISEVVFDTAVAYTPNADANGEDTFVVTVTDGINDVDVTVTVNIAPVNDAPVAQYDDFENDHSAFSYVYDTETESYSYLPTRTVVLEDEVTLLPVLDNDYDVDGDDIEIVVESISIDADIASFEVVDGAIELTPVDDWSGFFSFSYVITDRELESEPATVYVWVVPTLDFPVAEQDVAYVNEDDVVWVSVLENDYDADNPVDHYYDFDEEFDIVFSDDSLTSIGDDDDEIEGDFDDQQLQILSITQPENGFAFLVDDRIRVQPDPNFVGTLEIEYEIRSDFEPYWSGWEGSSTIDCSFEFDPFRFGPFGPIGGEYCPTTTGVLIVEVLGQNDSLEAANDTASTNEDEAVTVDVLANDTDIDGDELSVTRVGIAANGTVELIDGEVNYTPDENFFGTDDFVYFVTDGSVLVVAEVEVTVNSVNDLPTIEDENRNTAEDSALKFDLKIFDVEDDDLVPTLEVAPENGSVDIDGQTMTFTPEENWSGLATFGFKVDDGDGGVATNTVTINVRSVNDAPTIEDETATVAEDGSVDIDLDVNDVEGDDLSITVIAGPAAGSVSVDGTTITYTPDADVNGDDTFDVRVSDGELSATATVDVTINAVNDDPVAVACGPYEVEAGASIDIAALSCSTDVDGDALSIAADSVSASAGSVTDDGTTITFTAPNEAGAHTVTFSVTDGEGDAEVTVDVTVTAPPVEEPEEEEPEEEETEPASPFVGASGLEGQVVRTYSAMLGRTPDLAGFQWWVDQRADGMSFEEMVARFADSPEFRSIFGNRIVEDSNEEWVEFVYVEIMDRNPEPTGEAFWIEALETGFFTRVDMVIWFAESTEYKAITETN